MEGDTNRAEPEGSILPVFVVADVPSSVLDQLLQDDAIFQKRESLRLHILGAESAAELERVDQYTENGKERSRPPMVAGHAAGSPFLGWDLTRINEWFVTNIRAKGAYIWTGSMFLVVDKYSEATGTVGVVEADADLVPPKGPGAEVEMRRRREQARLKNPEYEGDEDNEPENIRCTFAVARQIATIVELGVQPLYENRDPNVVWSESEIPLQL
ncbi:hypothetical protein GGTG_12581 [Gaeumannomyces tritici R3-111a-1]|uniref:Uncharacterized protein n=1 Tax=Gaeumannomyces tritici (strain R3-111a-1) TaxID=644352 RepID=J3PGF6_GAET3|nr:hypothetical protein GGTG_12581 [Gaeumannomyces tritici R3-111a-1]EJT69698.1 hypothetical protein GGTG_12581 [Gaeumannomyces tritici R3-111a-1]